MSSCSLVGVVEDKSVLITVFQCHNQTANCLRIILSFYRPQNASKTPKLWDFEVALNFGTFPERALRIIVGSYGMILRPKFLYSLESWEPEVYFKLLQTSKSLQNTREMSNWKMMKFNQNITICVKSKMAFSTLLLAWKFIFFGARGLNVILICISIN